mgnify:CR=1 FL=1
MDLQTAHKSVLLHEVIDGLSFRDGDVFVDGTLGGGGHTESALGVVKDIKVFGFDRDRDALARSEARLSGKGDVTYINESFRGMDTVLQQRGITSVDKVLLDLGLSSDQFESSGRGFTFQKDEPLLMTMKAKLEPADLTARTIVNTWEAENIETILTSYGEERFARRIATTIVQAREKTPIETTFQLVEIIKRATPFAYHRGRIHPATKTFQALRITVNDEIGALMSGLDKGFRLLRSKGRMAVISFHSLEDRVVKQFFRKQSDEGYGILITKRPLVASEEEVKENPRSRSAKLRIVEKIS